MNNLACLCSALLMGLSFQLPAQISGLTEVSSEQWHTYSVSGAEQENTSYYWGVGSGQIDLGFDPIDYPTLPQPRTVRIKFNATTYVTVEVNVDGVVSNYELLVTVDAPPGGGGTGPTISISSSQSTVCGEESVSLFITRNDCDCDGETEFTIQKRVNGGNWEGVGDRTSPFVTAIDGTTTFRASLADGASGFSPLLTINYIEPPAKYAVTGIGSHCGGQLTQIKLSDSQTDVLYQLKKDGVNVGSAITGTGVNISLGSHSQVGNYQIIGTRANCSRVMNNTIVISGSPLSFNLAGGGLYCLDDPIPSIQLSGSEPGVIYKLLKDDNEQVGGNIAGDGSPLSWVSNIPGDHHYHVIAQRNECETLMNNTVFQGRVSAPKVLIFSGGGDFCLEQESTINFYLNLSEVGVSYNLLKNGSDTGFSKVGNGLPIQWEITKFIDLSDIGDYTVRAIRTPCTVDMSGTATVLVKSKPLVNYVTRADIQVDGVFNYSELEGLDQAKQRKRWIYLDGLGREIQNVDQGASPGGFDIIAPLRYDAFGRNATEYLPYTGNENSGVFRPGAAIAANSCGMESQQEFYQTATGIDNDPNPYLVKVFEPSPLNRVLKQGAAGESWQPNNDLAVTTDKVIRYRYETNQASDAVLLWRINALTNVLSTTSNYAIGQLDKTVVTDEDNHVVINYVDKLGRVILKQEETGEDDPAWAGTYYIYDDFGNLRYVLPPGAVEAIGSPGTFPHTPSPTVLSRWAFRYDYDGRRRMIKKKVPGADTLYRVYDNRDRLVLTQDGEQRAKDEWLFTKYDAFNRPILTGFYKAPSTLSQAAMQLAVDTHYSGPSASFYETLTGNVHGYTNVTFPPQGDESRYLSATYYDDYGFQGTVPGFGTSFNYQTPTAPPNCQEIPLGTYCYEEGAFDRVKGLVTGTKTRVLGTNQWIYMVTHYDDRYRVIQTVEVNGYQNSRERRSNLYSFSGWLLETYRDHTKDLQSHGLRNRYEYDHAGRLLKAYHEVFDDGSRQGEVLLSQHHYNELGELVTKKLHKLGQSAAYVQPDPLVGQANVRYDGQIVSGNYQGERAYIATGSIRLTPGFRVSPGAVFTARVGYSQQDAEIFNEQIEEYFVQQIDYRYNIRGWLTNINNASLDGTLGDINQPQDYWGMELGYNNTLTGVTTTPAYNGNISAVKWSDDLGQRIRAYAYAYDPMNRITDADHSIVGQTNTAAFDVTIRDGMNPGYDLNGNILKLSRGGASGAGMDILTYDYGTGSTRGNQLLSVTDDGDDTEGFKDGTHTGNDYLYDDNGNMTRDLNKDINDITYNHLNLPKTVTKADGSYIKYIYDAAGVKLAQEVYDDSNVLTKKTDYLDEFIYENEELQLIQHEEGRIVRDTATGNYEYQYRIADHLGNTRTMFTTKPKTIEFTANYEGDPNHPDDQSFFEKVQIGSERDFNHTTGNPNYTHAQVFRSSPHNQVGSAIAIPVGQGDKITAIAFAKYIAAAEDLGVSSMAIASALVSAFTGGASSGTEAGTGTINNNFGGGSLIGGTGFPLESGTAPRAFLNLMFLPGDAPVNLVKDVSFAYDQVADGATEAVIDGVSNSPFDELRIDNFVAPGQGYVMVYLSNEGSLMDVYFDDISITVEEHPVIEKTDYYPFGLTFNSYQRVTAKENRWKFQGQEHIEDLGLNWVSFKWRNHQPDIGRFFNIDPLTDKFYHLSPYAFSGNQVTAHIELEGLEPIRAPLPSARPRLFRPDGGNGTSIRDVAAEAARQYNTGFATIGRGEAGTFRRTTTFSTGRGEGSRVSAGNTFGRSDNSGGVTDNTHGFGNAGGNLGKVLVDITKAVDNILENSNTIQVTESFLEADIGTQFSLGKGITVDNNGTTMLLEDLQQSYNKTVQGLAQGDLSNEEWTNLDETERSGRLLGATLQAGESPLTRVLNAIQSGEIKNIEEKRLPTISQGN